MVGGLLGSAFNSLHYLLSCWREEALHTPQRAARGSRALEALAISALTSTVTFVLPLVFACTVRCASSRGLCLHNTFLR